MATGRKTVAPGQVIASDWGNLTWDQTVQQFASTADRNTQFPAPKAGAHSWTDAEKTEWLFDGTAWIPVRAPWASYTPAWGVESGGAAGVLGNGTLLGRYRITDKTCDIHIEQLYGSSTTGGRGVWSFGYPPGVVPAGTAQSKGVATVYVPSLSGAFPAVVSFLTTGIQFLASRSQTDTRIAPARNADTSGTAGTSIPILTGGYAYGAGANLIADGSFEIA
jgi:hypothetical protein